MSNQSTIVLSIGGSLVVPNGGLNDVFLDKLNAFIRDGVRDNKRFFLIVGGGATARHYIESAKTVIGNVTNEDLDWIGVHSTRLNAHLLRTILKDIAHPWIIDNYEKKLEDWSEPVVVGAGWKPGWSTDYCSVLLARDYQADLIVNMSNIDYVYDKDPNTHKDAKALETITWDQMEQLVGDTWTPGQNSPFDPIATKLAKELGLRVAIANGNNFENLKRVIAGDSFTGTVITP